MKRLIITMVVLGAFVLPAVAAGDLIDLKITDHGTSCFLSNNNTTVTCAGKISGLGNTVTRADISVPFTCTNKAGNTVFGQSGGSSGDITPANGSITFTATTTSLSDKCTSADGHTISFGATTTVSLYQNNNLVFQLACPTTGGPCTQVFP
jgi:hypothetical protein